MYPTKAAIPNSPEKQVKEEKVEPPPKQLVSGTGGKTILIKKYLKEARYGEMIFAIWKRNGVKLRLWKRFQIKIDFIVKICYNNITSIDISKKNNGLFHV